MKIEQEQEILNLRALIEDRQKEVFKKYQRTLKYSELYNTNVKPSGSRELIHG